MYIKILLIITIIFQSIATIYAIRLIHTTKYNSIWILFIIGFTVLSIERYIQVLEINGVDTNSSIYIWTGIIASIGLSIGVMYAHKLFIYIERLNRQRQLVSRRILSAVIRTEERSRSTISKELHDGLGPLLSSAKMSLSAISHDKSSPGEQREIIENTTYVIDEAIRTLREISNNLSPHILSDFGVNRAIQHFIKQGAAIHNTKIRYESNIKAKRYDSDIEVIVYRVVCEFINNSLKHAGCSAINLTLRQTNTKLIVDYSDNGCGFNPAAVVDCGMGLSNISSRINSLGGELEIVSSEGKGMSATIRIDVGSDNRKK
ncbi:MAG: sensor histidine kinase [Rikenellaceae bacterium]